MDSDKQDENSMTDTQYGEPWHYAYEGSGAHSVYSGNKCLTIFDDPEEMTDAEAESLAKRVVACVNFCRGVPTEILNGMTLEDFGVDLSGFQVTPGKNS